MQTFRFLDQRFEINIAKKLIRKFWYQSRIKIFSSDIRYRCRYPRQLYPRAVIEGQVLAKRVHAETMGFRIRYKLFNDSCLIKSWLGRVYVTPCIIHPRAIFFFFYKICMYNTCYPIWLQPLDKADAWPMNQTDGRSSLTSAHGVKFALPNISFHCADTLLLEREKLSFLSSESTRVLVTGGASVNKAILQENIYFSNNSFFQRLQVFLLIYEYGM